MLEIFEMKTSSVTAFNGVVGVSGNYAVYQDEMISVLEV